MGNCCQKKKNYIRSDVLEDRPEKNLIDITENDINITVEEFFDEKRAKQLVKFILDPNQFSLVSNLSPNDFRILFQGNSDYNFSVDEKDKYRFKSLAIKFENYSSLLNSWYKKDRNYYECLKDIWTSYHDALYELKKSKNKNEFEFERKLDKICKSEYWTSKIREEFVLIINNLNDISDKYKKLLEEKLADIDNMIKGILASKEGIEKKEEENKEMKSDNDVLAENAKSLVKGILGNVLNLFYKDLKSEFKKNMISLEEKDNISKISENQKKKIVESTLIKYSGLEELDLNKTLETAQQIEKHINYENLFSEKTKEKIIAIKDMRMTSHIILGLNFLNLCNYINQTYEIFTKSKNEKKSFCDDLDKIKINFIKHKNEMTILDFDNDKSKSSSLKKMIELRLKIEEDKNDVEKLIKNIEKALKEQKEQRDKNLFKSFISGATLFITSYAAHKSKGSNKVEYAFCSILSGVNLVGGVVDTGKILMNIKDYKNILNEAKELQKEINEIIDQLNKKILIND